MNRYPLWKYLTVLVALVLGFLYTLPNFFGEAPAVQVSSAKSTVKVEPDMQRQVQDILAQAGIANTGLSFERNGPVGTVRVRFADTDTQLLARDVIERTLNPDPTDPSYTVALNLLPASPKWLSAIGANPMYLGLDLRGGVHFLLQVDMRGALTARYESLATEIRTALREERIPSASSDREGLSVVVVFPDEQARERALALFNNRYNDMTFTPGISQGMNSGKPQLTGELEPGAIAAVQNAALKQNITTLHNRVNELGVAEPVIQQQGADRIVVQLPGVQDVARPRTSWGAPPPLKSAWSMTRQRP